jgi:plastocyanin
MLKSLYSIPSDFLVKIGLGAALLVGLLVGVLSSALTPALAQDMAPAQYTVQAGTFGPGNVELLQFAPQSLQVHKGDTVTWAINSFHNVHFEDAPVDLVVAPEVDGKPLPQINPAVAFPTADSGSSYQGGEANSGLLIPPAPPTFSLVIDAEPGTYPYMCDVHPGMLGSITVVGNDVAIPSPAEVDAQAGSEFGATLGQAVAAFPDLESLTADSTDTGVTVQMGNSGTGRATVNQYFPFSATIQVGQSVTWTNPADSIEPHVVAWPPARNQDVAPMPQEGGPPILALGPTIAPMTQSGASIGASDTYSSGLVLPGQSFTLTFNEAGTYPYVCNIHPGMTGVITVEPAM